MVNKGIWIDILSWCFIIIILLFSLIPFLWIISSSFKTRSEQFSLPIRWVPEKPTLENYRYFLFDNMNYYIKFLKNSIVVALGVILFSVIPGSLGAYSITRFRTGGNVLPLFVLVQRMVPPVAIGIPFFIMLYRFQLIDTKLGLILAHVNFNLPFSLWLMLGFFRQIPIELEEAAMIDGCNRLQTFVKIVLPLVAPGIAVVTIFTLIQSWNEFFFAIIITRSISSQTLPVVISSLVIPVIGIQYGKMAAAGIISVIPIIILSLFAQKYLVKGLTTGAVKG